MPTSKESNLQITPPYGYSDIVPLQKTDTALLPAEHKALMTKDLMGRIYAHIHSLENFARLYSRAMARAGAPSRPR